MNPVTPEFKTSMTGELLVQLLLYTFDIQAAKPIIDTGNDLIAFKGRIVKGIQVKTTETSPPRRDSWNLPGKSTEYDILALVGLSEEAHKFDNDKVYLLSREEVGENRGAYIRKNLFDSLATFELSDERLSILFR